jgi:hypothetical protein
MGLLNFMPPKDEQEPLVYVQAKVTRDLRDQVKQALKTDGYTIQDLVANSFMTYLDERKNVSKAAAKKG